MKELGRMIKQYNELPDEDFFYDRLYFMKKNYNNDQNIYKSKKLSDCYSKQLNLILKS